MRVVQSTGCSSLSRSMGDIPQPRPSPELENEAWRIADVLTQDGAPKIAKLPYFSGFMVDITIVFIGVIMVYKPTYNWGAPCFDSLFMIFSVEVNQVAPEISRIRGPWLAASHIQGQGGDPVHSGAAAMPVMQISHPKTESFMLEVINSAGGNCNSMAG